jgi:hypothetical protein
MNLLLLIAEISMPCRDMGHNAVYYLTLLQAHLL